MTNPTAATTPEDGHTAPPGDELPREWDDIDHAIYEARVRNKQSWRAVGQQVGLDWSAARRRFYRRMQAVEVPEIQAMRTLENEKLDDRERRAQLVYSVAMAGVPIRVNGQPVMQVAPDGVTLIAATERELGAALGALREEHRVAQLRAKLNGLEAPVRVEFSDVTVDDEIEAAFRIYGQGLADAAAADADHRADR